MADISEKPTIAEQPSLVADIEAFVQAQEQPGSLSHSLINAGMVTETELKEQYATFPSAVEKMRKGEMSYAEMRALYG
jgi:hypothetical protein